MSFSGTIQKQVKVNVSTVYDMYTHAFYLIIQAHYQMQYFPEQNVKNFK